MSEFVTMVHPDLPGQPIKVRASKTGPRFAGGWEIQPEQPAKALNDEESEAAPKRPSKRRADATDKKEEAV